MINKKAIFWVVILLVALLGFILVDGPSSNKESVKIGVIAPLTGRGASRGESVVMGLQLAQEKIKKFDVPIELVYQDVPLDKARNAPGAFNQLVEFENVVAVIGPAGSNVALSVTPLVDEKEVPIIIHTASVSAATKDNEFVFRLWPTDKIYADAMIPRLKSLNLSRMAVLSATTDNTLGLLGFLEKEIDFVVSERATVDAKDFRTELSKIKETQPDVLVLNLFTAQNGLAAKQAREVGLNVPIVTNSVTSVVDLDVGPEYLEGAWLPQFAGYSDKVRQEFIDTFGSDAPDPDSAAAAHDALLVFAEAISKVGTEGEKIKNYLHQNEFTGSIGTFHFQESGDATVPLKFEVIRGGKFVGLE